MVKLRIVFFVLLAGALLAGCSQMAAPGGAVEPQFISVPTPAPSPLTALAPSDGLAVEVLGTGLGSDGGPSTGSTVVIPDPDTVVSLYVQVVTKVSDGLPDAGLPDRVDVTTTGGSPTALSWAGTPADTLTKVEIVGGNGAHRTDGLGWSFEGVVAGPGTTSVSASVTGATDPYGPRALIVYVLRDAASGVGDSAGFPEVWSFGNDGVPSVERTLPLPSGFAGGDVSVTFAVSDLQNDVRYVRLEAEAGSASAGQSYDKPNRNDELLIASLTLHDVPAGAAEVTARVLTPAKQKGDATWGDSVFWDGVTLHANPATTGGQGCTPGYWKQPHHFDSWVGFAPGDDLATVFGLLEKLTLRTGGRSTTDTPTLLQGLQAPGGDVNALARHAVAALLNASSSEVAYPYTAAQVLDMVKAAVEGGDVSATKDLLAGANELGCPLN